MITKKRHDLMLEMIKKSKTVSIMDLANELGISQVTARRDIEHLEKNTNKIAKIRGGAEWKETSSTSSTDYLNTRFYEQYEKNKDKKERIAQKAAVFIQEKDNIIIDAGSTMLHLARFIDNSKKITAFLTAVNIAEELEHKSLVTKILMGGVFRSRTTTMISSMIEQSLSNIYADKVFVGASALSIQHGFSCNDILEADVKKILLKSANEIFWLVDSAKFDNIASFQISEIQANHTIITDDGLDPKLIKEFGKKAKLIIVGKDESM
ncbi:DeoR/GlpR family DNA-binding transcription regulator [Niallia nealsonii]|uniref:HTH deoR-type domain-containing protein n=1 Tax=Niallia nealsonii TaxID=115979 RepID=A0A2N0Z569_9BACI|nr:DeoR/GlpR family DNA-binding transcription regulator [Niallia nealsonii]PKG24661.1 hypothetical protein CWS01_05225 [Niallia nealsonii]